MFSTCVCVCVCVCVLSFMFGEYIFFIFWGSPPLFLTGFFRVTSFLCHRFLRIQCNAFAFPHVFFPHEFNHIIIIYNSVTVSKHKERTLCGGACVGYE